MHAGQRPHSRKRTADFSAREDHLLANFDRCRGMVQAENFERHSWL